MILYLELLGVGPVKKNTLYIYLAQLNEVNLFNSYIS